MAASAAYDIGTQGLSWHVLESSQADDQFETGQRTPEAVRPIRLIKVSLNECRFYIGQVSGQFTGKLQKPGIRVDAGVLHGDARCLQHGGEATVAATCVQHSQRSRQWQMFQQHKIAARPGQPGRVKWICDSGVELLVERQQTVTGGGIHGIHSA